MGFRNDCQDSLKLEQFVKNILYRYMDIMFDFLNMVMFQNTVSSLKICYKKNICLIFIVTSMLLAFLIPEMSGICK